jgi:hypothetical protein
MTSAAKRRAVRTCRRASLIRSVEGDRHQWLALDLGDEWFRLLGVPSGTVVDDRVHFDSQVLLD